MWFQQLSLVLSPFSWNLTFFLACFSWIHPPCYCEFLFFNFKFSSSFSTISSYSKHELMSMCIHVFPPYSVFFAYFSKFINFLSTRLNLCNIIIFLFHFLCQFRGLWMSIVRRKNKFKHWWSKHSRVLYVNVESCRKIRLKVQLFALFATFFYHHPFPSINSDLIWNKMFTNTRSDVPAIPNLH